MAERIILKARVDGIDLADVITSEAGIDTATWEAQPVTLRDDEVSIVENDPEEDETFSHENDAPEDYDISGTGMTAVGSFIKASYEQMAELLGGKTAGEDAAKKYLHSSKKLVLEKAIRFRLKNGGSIIIPCAKGSVQFNANMGFDGLLKFPFRFRALTQTGFDTDLVIM
ncbi:hypothetical protein LJC38_00090 [Parabacteroides sp. OttesenSCG-928-K15]|nr:hypothetical protein [Parabacteroides sp. OttesenSCG-928-K15]